MAQPQSDEMLVETNARKRGIGIGSWLGRVLFKFTLGLNVAWGAWEMTLGILHASRSWRRVVLVPAPKP